MVGAVVLLQRISTPTSHKGGNKILSPSLPPLFTRAGYSETTTISGLLWYFSYELCIESFSFLFGVCFGVVGLFVVIVGFVCLFFPFHLDPCIFLLY